jgi:hypothetical protein
MLNLEDDTQYGAKGRAIADLVGIGKNVAIPCDINVREVF